MSSRDRDIFTTLRIIKGKTSADVARASGLSYKTILNLRKDPQAGGTMWPSYRTLKRIWAAYNIEMVLLNKITGEIIERKENKSKKIVNEHRSVNF